MSEQQMQNQQDNTLELLKAMTPEQRVEWAKAQGAEGIMALMELQEELMEQKLSEMAVEQRQQVLDAIATEWAEANRELVENEELSKIAKGIDLVLLEEKGYDSYVEMSPAELKAHLEEVAEQVKKIAFKEDGKGDEDKNKGKGEGTEDITGKRVTHLGDMGGEGAGASLGNKVSLENLASAIEDPLKFEEAVSQLDDNQLYELMRQAEAGK